jgi:hypothetical protein
VSLEKELGTQGEEAIYKPRREPQEKTATQHFDLGLPVSRIETVNWHLNHSVWYLVIAALTNSYASKMRTTLSAGGIHL